MTDPIKLVQNEPRQVVIDHLEYLLKEAKDGTMRSIAYACVYTEQKTGSGWCGVDEDAGKGTTLIGELSVVQARIETQIIRKYHADEVSP